MLEYKRSGIYSPEDLSEMSKELDLGAIEGETSEDRETRGEIILRRRNADRTQRTAS